MKKILSSLLLLFLFFTSAGLALGSAPQAKTLRGISIHPPASSVLVGSSESFEIKGYYSDYSDYRTGEKIAQWSISAPIGTISESGVFTATKPGTAEIIATMDKLTATARITVTTEVNNTTPPTPMGLRITEITTNSAIADWDASGIPEEYVVSLGTDENASNGGIPWRVTKPYKVRWTIPIARKLPSGEIFYIKVLAFNRFGFSRYCQPVSFTTRSK